MTDLDREKFHACLHCGWRGRRYVLGKRCPECNHLVWEETTGMTKAQVNDVPLVAPSEDARELGAAPDAEDADMSRGGPSGPDAGEGEDEPSQVNRRPSSAQASPDVGADARWVACAHCGQPIRGIFVSDGESCWHEKCPGGELPTTAGGGVPASSSGTSAGHDWYTLARKLYDAYGDCDEFVGSKHAIDAVHEALSAFSLAASEKRIADLTYPADGDAT